MKTKFITTISLLTILIAFTFSNSTYGQNKKNKSDSVISEITTRETSLNKRDVMKYFCLNLTEYFNSYKYYKISSEVYTESVKQTEYAISKITQDGSLYKIQYLGAGGNYTITFSNRDFSDSEQIFTFGRKTVLGNAIRSKVYDTFVSWLQRTEISLKANNNSQLYLDEITSAIELENWYNDLNGNK